MQKFIACSSARVFHISTPFEVHVLQPMPVLMLKSKGPCKNNHDYTWRSSQSHRMLLLNGEHAHLNFTKRNCFCFAFDLELIHCESNLCSILQQFAKQTDTRRNGVSGYTKHLINIIIVVSKNHKLKRRAQLRLQDITFYVQHFKLN